MKWKMPKWMEPYRKLIANTGGNSIEDLMNDTTTTFYNNSIRACFIIGTSDQLNLLQRLHKKGMLVKEKSLKTKA